MSILVIATKNGSVVSVIDALVIGIYLNIIDLN